jgi:hypothetical protein
MMKICLNPSRFLAALSIIPSNDTLEQHQRQHSGSRGAPPEPRHFLTSTRQDLLVKTSLNEKLLISLSSFSHGSRLPFPAKTHNLT